MNIEFLSPHYFWLLILIPIVIYFDIKIKNKWINIWFLSDLQKIFWKTSFLFWINTTLKPLILLLFIIILANPNIANTKQKTTKHWIDIVIALDISESMLEQDISPNRLEWAKKVIWEFTSRLDWNRLGILLFAWKPFISSPLTFDYNALIDYIKNISTKSINQWVYWLNWTAIWDAMLMGINTLLESWNNEKLKKEKVSQKDWRLEKWREKIIILISDWEANRWANPVIAANYANDNKIKIYTIWIWSSEIRYWSDIFWNKVELPHLDEKTMKNVSDISWWRYFNASNNRALEDIFTELSNLTKSDIEVDIVKEYAAKYKIFLHLLIVIMMIYFWTNSYYQLIK